MCIEIKHFIKTYPKKKQNHGGDGEVNNFMTNCRRHSAKPVDLDGRKGRSRTRGESKEGRNAVHGQLNGTAPAFALRTIENPHKPSSWPTLGKESRSYRLPKCRP